MNSKRINYSELYKLLNTLTPLHVNCGQLCGAACCKARHNAEAGESDNVTAASGMLLFPGEEAIFEGKEGFTVLESPAENEFVRRLLVCTGTCCREERPLACRIFPLFPLLTESGRIRVVYDPRAFAVCPLVRSCEAVRCEPVFTRVVGKIGRRLASDTAGRAFLQQQSAEITELSRFLPLDRQRPPIARRPLQRSE